VISRRPTYTDAFTRSLLPGGGDRPTDRGPSPAAMPGPTGPPPLPGPGFPDRFRRRGAFAEQHAVDRGRRGMAHRWAPTGGRRLLHVLQPGLRPGQPGLSAFMACPWCSCSTGPGHPPGDDGPSHHGVLDLALTLSIPGMTVFHPLVGGRGSRSCWRRRSPWKGPSVIPVPQDPGAARVATGDCRTGGLTRATAPGRGRLGVHPGRRQDGGAGPKRRAGHAPHRRGGGHRLGTSGVVSPPEFRTCWPTAGAP